MLLGHHWRGFSQQILCLEQLPRKQKFFLLFNSHPPSVLSSGGSLFQRKAVPRVYTALHWGCEIWGGCRARSAQLTSLQQNSLLRMSPSPKFLPGFVLALVSIIWETHRWGAVASRVQTAHRKGIWYFLLCWWKNPPPLPGGNKRFRAGGERWVGYCMLPGNQLLSSHGFLTWRQINWGGLQYHIHVLKPAPSSLLASHPSSLSSRFCQSRAPDCAWEDRHSVAQYLLLVPSS